eukprot:Protomagalhaensia_sp_Gyna_25__1443@NODE_172_length_4653_cov_470_453186_g134_i0_p3_GENE_NODE_172_length_4653_cov_470_453186_g134_i0NODE_172_length_4653_cov_470_453186_g134_i0_p3_ORF_typecomplete_len292_score32_54Mito_carr/PF00153_27/3_4e03Mito_carr/PF00153_27/63Mito_carr/PF00153_27/1_8Erf4/PF10256_9/0_22_NODE_172_length_4653_cov_470_453186_g134_i031634038
MSDQSPIEVYLTKPLTQLEEARLSTLGNCITLACFRPLDTFNAAIKKSRESGKLRTTHLLKGWPRQALNKALDDEIFNSNIRRVNSFIEETFNYKNPSKSTYGKAAVGTLARCLTLTVMVPYHHITDPEKRKSLAAKRNDKQTLVPFTPLYTGLQRSLIKESIFTASYVILSAYFGDIFVKHREAIASHVERLAPKHYTEEKKARATDVAIASLRAAAAGVCASLLSQPVDMARKGIPLSKQITIASRKAFRKGCYNGINTIIVQSLYSSKIHRRFFWSVAPPLKEASTKA